MERVPDILKPILTGDVVRSWRALENGSTPAVEGDRQKYWAHWKIYVQQWQFSPFLDDATQLESNIIIGAFAARVRTGFYGYGDQVKVQSVTKALAAISSTIELAGQPSPIYRADKKYQRGLEKMIEGMRREDPLPRAQLAVPVKVVREAARIAKLHDDPKHNAMADLMVIAFYFLLRSGEYTKPRFVTTKGGKRRKATRTVQFSVKDCGFFNGTQAIDKSTASLDDLVNATSATLRMGNQKNGRMGECIHQEKATNEKYGPTPALAHRVHHILANGGNEDSLICEFKLKNGDWDCIQAGDIVHHV